MNAEKELKDALSGKLSEFSFCLFRGSLYATDGNHPPLVDDFDGKGWQILALPPDVDVSGKFKWLGREEGI